MNLQEGEWVVNESFARAVNSEEFQGENLGALLGLDALPFQGRITGVVSDFHYRSLHSEIGPLALQIGRDGFNTLNVRLQAGSVGPTLDRLREAWSEVAGGVPMEYTFLDDSIADIYRSSHRFAQIFWAFSLVTIVIACMGLFSLAALAARRRTREIGIRKVLGATTESIVARLSGDFLLQVAVGFLIAAPVAWYAMDRWLADFAYRVEIGIGVFALAGGAALLIALLTVSWQSVRAARANPVESLRSE